MRAIIIDSKARRIYETEVDGKLASLQQAVGGKIERAACPGLVDDCYVNEEGLDGARDFFIWQGAHQPFAGNAIIIGFDDMGASRSAKTPLAMVKAMVKFADILTVRQLVAMRRF